MFLEYHHLYMGWCALWSTHDCWDAYPSIPEKAGINHWRIFPNIGVIKMWVSVDSRNIHGACWQQEGKTSVVHRGFQWDYHEFLNQQFTNNSPTVKNHWLVSSFSPYHKSDCQLESSTIGLSDNVGYAWACHLIWLVVCHLIWLVVYLPLWKIWVSWDDEIPNLWKHNSNVWNHQPPFHIPLPEG